VTLYDRFRTRLGKGDDGVTLIELLVTMVIMSIVLILAMTAFQASSRVYWNTNDDATGLADARKIAERLGRDIRNARGVDSGATTSKLVLWIDVNSDYIRQPSESVTWQLQASAQAGHYDILRTSNGTTTVVEARSLVSQIAFTYNVAAPNTTTVSTEVTYDAYVGNGSGTRTLYFVDRLRNVGT
jgi:prepilin-type N-terminal cleavage/methylation domain-containing protein